MFRKNSKKVYNLLVVYSVFLFIINCWFLFKGVAILKLVVFGLLLYVLNFAANFSTPTESYSVDSKSMTNTKTHIQLFDVLIYAIIINGFIYLRMERTPYKLVYLGILLCSILLSLISENSLSYNVFHAVIYASLVYYILSCDPKLLLRKIKPNRGLQHDIPAESSRIVSTPLSELECSLDNITDF